MKALIFDFDGTILDTEQTELAAWQFIYSEYNCILPIEHWYKRIGTDAENFDPILHLEQLIGTKLNSENINKRRREKLSGLIANLQPFPGVLNWILAAKDFGMKLAVASSSPRYWVEGHLKRVDLLKYFDVIVTREDVKKLKPDPEIYQLTLKELELGYDEAIAIEDSPSGASSALAAGIQCIVVPNQVTAQLNFPSTVRFLRGLDEYALYEILRLD